MGNVTDKDHDVNNAWPFGEQESEDNFGTIDRDFKYRDFGRSSRKTPPARSVSKDRNSGRKKSVSRSGTGRRRSSFKAKHSVTGRPMRRSSSIRSKDKNKGSAVLIADMEVKVDGKVAKLVLRNSVLRRRAEVAVNSSNSSILTTDNTSSSIPASDNTSESLVTSDKSSRHKRVRHVPKDSMKLESALELHHSPGRQLEKRSSYEAAVISSIDSSTSNNSLAANEPTSTSCTTVAVLPRVNNINNSKVNHKHRWSNIDFSPKKLIFNHHKHRPKSTYENINNNNTSSTGPSNPETLNLLKEGNSKCKQQSTVDSRQQQRCQDLSSKLSNLVVSPITDT